jgi:selenide,water dikinase
VPAPKLGPPALSTFASTAGCACKIGQFDLSALLARLPAPADPNLLVGNSTSDDAAVYRIGGGQALVFTVDFFTPVVDDPFVFGQIAAANALSDVYAMGGRPILALALTAFPMSVLPTDVLEQILRGGVEKVTEAGAVVGGGHSIDHDIPLYGLAVTGTVEETKVVRNGGALPGDALVLTKPLGIGLTVRAGRMDTVSAGADGTLGKRLLSEAASNEAIAVMTQLNRAGAEAMDGFSVHAATDVTGFGLLGHAHEMMEASGTTGEFRVEAIPLLSEARRLAALGAAPGGSRRNVSNLSPRTERAEGVTDEDLLILCDAQTSGGLLVALPETEAEAYAAECRRRGAVRAAVVGRVLERGEKPLRVVKESGRSH